MTATENVDLRSQGAGSMETMQPGDGWLYFAGTVMGLAGLMRLVDSLWAFRYNGNLPDGLQDGVLGDNIKTYAWLWLAVGVMFIAASFLILTRNQLARWIGMIASVVGAVSAMAWMPYYPIWALTYVAIGVLALYGLIAYGGRLSTDT